PAVFHRGLQPLYSFRRRNWSGDLPGLQSRRFGPSRVEWWVRLPHASARPIESKRLTRCRSDETWLCLFERSAFPRRACAEWSRILPMSILTLASKEVLALSM